MYWTHTGDRAYNVLCANLEMSIREHKTSMAEYDTISKHLIQTYPDDFVRFTLQRDDVTACEVLNPEQPTVETRQTDSLIRAQIAGEEALVHHEFQTTDHTNPPMPLRMASYIVRAIEHHRQPVYSSVIYLRPDAGRRDPGYYAQDLPGHRILVQYKVIRLSEIEGQVIVQAGPSGLLPFTPLMKRPAGMGKEAWLRQCIQATHAGPLDPAVKVDFLGGLAILSGLAYEWTTIRSIISQEGLMDTIMRESSFAQYLTQQGIEQGVRKRAVEDILDVLEIRFGAASAHSFAARIAAINDLHLLKQLHRMAVQAADLEVFQRHLDTAE